MFFWLYSIVGSLFLLLGCNLKYSLLLIDRIFNTPKILDWNYAIVIYGTFLLFLIINKKIKFKNFNFKYILYGLIILGENLLFCQKILVNDFNNLEYSFLGMGIIWIIYKRLKEDKKLFGFQNLIILVFSNLGSIWLNISNLLLNTFFLKILKIKKIERKRLFVINVLANLVSIILLKFKLINLISWNYLFCFLLSLMIFINHKNLSGIIFWIIALFLILFF